MNLMVLFNQNLRDKKIHIFPKGISPKVNVIARLESELAYYNVTVQHVTHYTVVTLPHEISKCSQYHGEFKHPESKIRFFTITKHLYFHILFQYIPQIMT